MGRPGRRGAGRVRRTNQPLDEPFTRADPVLAPLCRNTVLTAALSSKEVRQFGFDISEFEIGYAVGDALGVCATNSPAVVDAWLAATGLRGDETVEVDGADRTLRDALTRSYDICRVTPDLIRFVAENSGDPAAAKALRAPNGRLDKWLDRAKRAGHRRGIHRACRPRAVAGGVGEADAAELLDLIEPAGQPP